MNYYIDVFSPETYAAWSKTERTLAGFTEDKENALARMKKGDRLVCYLKGEMAWIGVLEVTADETVNASDPDGFVLQKRVRALHWTPPGQAPLLLKSPQVWEQLSFTKGKLPGEGGWSFAVRRSAAPFPANDARVLESLLNVPPPVVEPPLPEEPKQTKPRESLELQALLSRIGAALGFQVWVPRADKTAVSELCGASPVEFLEQLPFASYSEPVLRTVENIDVLWLQKNTIIRAFEVEHTTAVYSGILRMADLLALQPNFSVKLHIVAPEVRRGKVLYELARPAFSVYEQGAMSDLCSYIPYDGIRKLAADPHLKHFRPEVLEQYEEFAG